MDGIVDGTFDGTVEMVVDGSDGTADNEASDGFEMLDLARKREGNSLSRLRHLQSGVWALLDRAKLN
jgi:hypothetical protein